METPWAQTPSMLSGGQKPSSSWNSCLLYVASSVPCMSAKVPVVSRSGLDVVKDAEVEGFVIRSD